MTTTAPITNAHTADEEEMMLSVVRELVAKRSPRAPPRSTRRGVSVGRQGALRAERSARHTDSRPNTVG